MLKIVAIFFEDMMNQRITPIIAIAAGASAYVVVFLSRAISLGTIGTRFSGRSISVSWMDASAIFLMTMLSGFVVRMLYPRFLLLNGFLAGAFGEIARGFLDVFLMTMASDDAANMGSLPTWVILQIVASGIPSGILGAAGAAVAAELFRKHV